MCGENMGAKLYDYVMGGSPPRVRGKLKDVAGSDIVVRITPACAGKTSPTAYDIASGQDHPRVCGENRGKLRPF